MGYEPEACDQRGKCMEYYVCEADGSVYPCDFYMLDEYRLGNINEDEIAVLDRRRNEIGFVKESEKLDKVSDYKSAYRKNTLRQQVLPWQFHRKCQLQSLSLSPACLRY